MNLFYQLLSIRSASLTIQINKADDLPITRVPFVCDCIISTSLQALSLLDETPDIAISAKSSAIDLIASALRAEYLSHIMTTLEEFNALAPCPVDHDSATEPRPRIAELSGRVEKEIQFSLASLRLTLEPDNVTTSSTELGSFDYRRAKEILFEEAVSDFLSHLSCYNLTTPPEESINSSVQVCVDRLASLGLGRDVALSCVLNARENFLSDLHEMKSQMLVEINAADSKKSVPTLTPNDLLDADFPIPGRDIGDEINTEAAAAASRDEGERWENDSAESFDIIETTMKNAVEKTVLGAMSLLSDTTDSYTVFNPLIVEMTSDVDIALTSFTYDRVATLSAASLDVKNGKGAHYLWIQPPVVDASLSSASNGQSLAGVHVSYCEKDEPDGVGDGGYATALLCDAEAAAAAERPREKLVEVDMANVDIVFVEKDLTESIRAASAIVDAISVPDVTASTGMDDTSHRHELLNEQSPSLNFKGAINSLSILFASNEIVPFTRFAMNRVVFDFETASAFNDWTNKLHLVSRSFKVADLTPEGQSHPEFISEVSTQDENGMSPMLEIIVTDPEDIWHRFMDVQVRLSSARIVVLRRFVHELMQYFLTPLIGFGKFKATFGNDHGEDENGNSPPPLRYHVDIVNSSFILPIDSQSKELVAVEASNVAVSSYYVKDTWSDIDGDFDTDEGRAHTSVSSTGRERRKAYEISSKSPRMATTGSSIGNVTDGADDSFYDCIADKESIYDSDKSGIPDQKISSHDNQWIERVIVRADAVRILTTSGSGTLASEGRLLYLSPGRAQDGASVYNVKKDYGSSPPATADASFSGWTWRELTLSCVDMEVVIDYVSHDLMRVLLKDHFLTRTQDEARPLRLNMERPQLYLVMSVWYRNVSKNQREE